MKTLIFGARGQLGRSLALTAPEAAKVVGLTRDQCDITDSGAVEAAVELVRPNIIFIAAAYTSVDLAERERETARQINEVGPAIVAAAAARAKARVVHISTDFVFDGESASARSPDDPPNPLSVYGQTKLAGERAVLSASPDALVVRTAWVYASQGTNFVNTMLRLMRERDVVRVVCDQFGTPTYANSVARALWTLVGKGASGIHHFTDSGVASWYDFAVAIHEEATPLGLVPASTTVRPIATADFPTPARRPVCSVLDKSASWTLLGGPAPHWRVNLRACLQELLNV